MKFLSVLSCLCLFSLSILEGASEAQMRDVETRISKLETARNQPLSPITPSARPHGSGELDRGIFVDFLYWSARLDTLTYATTGYQSPKRGETRAVDWSWDPGFKVGLGWNLAHGSWDILLEYTWFYSNASGDTQSQFLQSGFSILPHSFQQGDLTFGTRAHAHYDLHYQVVDLELGRNYYISPTLKLRPFIGIKGTWQKEDYNAFYESVSLQAALFDVSSRMGQSIWGLGVRGGLATAWQFSKAFSLYGNIGFTGMGVDYHLERKDTFRPIDTNEDPTVTANIEATPNLVKPVLEFALGLRAEKSFSRYHFLVQAGWESHIWINQTLMINLNESYDRFDLTLQGFTGRVRFDF